jgi:hypothetical protein
MNAHWDIYFTWTPRRPSLKILEIRQMVYSRSFSNKKRIIWYFYVLDHKSESCAVETDRSTAQHNQHHTKARLEKKIRKFSESDCRRFWFKLSRSQMRYQNKKYEPIIADGPQNLNLRRLWRIRQPTFLDRPSILFSTPLLSLSLSS